AWEFSVAPVPSPPACWSNLASRPKPLFSACGPLVRMPSRPSNNSGTFLGWGSIERVTNARQKVACGNRSPQRESSMAVQFHRNGDDRLTLASFSWDPPFPHVPVSGFSTKCLYKIRDDWYFRLCLLRC